MGEMHKVLMEHSSNEIKVSTRFRVSHLSEMGDKILSGSTHLRTGLDTAIGVGTPPIAFILAIVGVADDDDKFPTPIRGTPDCCICCSGDNASGV